MAKTTLANPSRLRGKRIVFISFICSFIMVVMYFSNSSKRNEIEDGRVEYPILSVLKHNSSLDENFENTYLESNLPKNIEQITFESVHSPKFELVSSSSVAVGDTDDEYITKSEEQGSKRILIWNAYWKSKAIWHKIFNEVLYKRCPQTNCEITTDRSSLNEADAIIFHLPDMYTENYTFPETRDPNQIWIGMTYEPPFILKTLGLNFTRLNGIFNRTMSYRTDGDIVVRHGTFGKITSQSRATLPKYFSNWVNSHESTEKRNYAEGKRRLIAWFASSRNCTSQSGRENYIKELQNYVQVDIYGLCGPYKCGVQKTMRHPYKVEEDDCYMLVSIGYKFVLAFENSLCEDYVTEKLYNHLKLNTIPVVFGASNYTQFAPPNSIIDAGQYTPEELANYLQLLDKNDTLYNQYFEWKKNYVVEAHDGVPLACDLCEQLHNPNWQVERKVYDQFDTWITSGCRKGYEA